MSTLPKAQDDSEDEIPLLVPLKETPAAGSAKIQKAATGKKSPKKSPGPNTARGKKRTASPALETPIAAEPKTPGKGPGKKARVKEEVEKERNSSLGKKDLRQTITSSMNTSCSLHWNLGHRTLGSPTPALTLSLAWLHLIALEMDCLEREGRQWEGDEVACVLRHV